MVVVNSIQSLFFRPIVWMVIAPLMWLPIIRIAHNIIERVIQ